MKPLTCQQCEKTFSKQSNLKRHEETVHDKQNGNICDVCGKIFSSKYALARHKRSVHENVKVKCSKCDKQFTRNIYRVNHEAECQGPSSFDCDQCPASFANHKKLRDHQKMHKRPPEPALPPAKRQKVDSNEVRCRRCFRHFQNRRDLYNHTMRQHFPRGHDGLQREPFDVAPWELDGGQIEEGLRECYETNKPLILAQHEQGPVVSIYNVPISPNMTVADITEAITEIYEYQTHAFKINLTFGMILRHVQTGEYRYFRPFTNLAVFEEPLFVGRRNDLRRVADKLNDMDLVHEMSKVRPDTKWRLALITNIRFQVFSTNFVLGTIKIPLPNYIKRHKAILNLEKDSHNRIYADNLCAFRCLSVHREQETLQLYNQWQEYQVQKLYVRSVSAKDYKGLQLSELIFFEHCFGINLNVYELAEDGIAVQIFKTSNRYDDTMYLNHINNHLSYIKDFAKYAKQYKCDLCDRVFNKFFNLKRHTKICDNRTKYRYPGGFYKEPKTVFQQLDEVGIHVPENDRIYHHFAVFDFESLLKRVRDDNNATLKWSHEHIPISVSICSNVEGYTEPQCFVNNDLDKLLEQMIDGLTKIQEKSLAYAKSKWGKFLERLKEKLEPLDDEKKEERLEKQKLENLYGKIQGYMAVLPVLGFNSAKYDLNLIKRKLAKHLELSNDEYGFVVKKANAYACISTQNFKFLDISHFLAPGTSYSGFLKAYKVEETKGFFPYEWLDDFGKLGATELPPQTAFYSSLKGTNISNEDYAFCQKIWRDKQMTTFKDFLIWYNQGDTKPFITAVERMQKFYFDKGIDLFKISMSVPGLSRRMIFKSAKEQGAEFSIIDKRNKDLHDTIKANIIGGPSIIFTRYHTAGETFIRGDKPCQRVVGYDANALYLWAIGRELPIGVFARRFAHNDFRPQFRDSYMQAFNWLNYLNRHEGRHILHARNNGNEVRIGKYPVDGFESASNTIFQFQGCYFHGHDCILTEKVTDKSWRDGREERLRKTVEISQYLRQAGYTVVEMWECEFKQFCQSHKAIYDIIYESRPLFSQKHRGRVSEKQILNGVRFGHLFGMVEVDIEVPEQWGIEFQKTLPPKEFFSEMCPLFCNTEVTFDDIGEHMQAHIWSQGLSDRSRRLLVSGLKAQQILLATPLLKWYLDHGLKVTKIYQVIEYGKMACFKSFVDEVSDARRAGDASKEMGIIADTMKLIGNSGYGSMIMDKTKHRNVTYASDENAACYKVNDPRFRSMSCLDAEDGYYEIESAKTKIDLDMPIQLGYFILQYAKLRMLAFYYDFLDYYIDRSNFEYLEMDTDSAYMALAAPSVSELVKPELKEQFDRAITGLCSDDYNDVGQRWLPRECCDKHKKFDKRVPGLFKTEYEGEELIGLCSKTYIVSKEVASKPECKFSSKGVGKRFVNEPLEIFRNVLRSGKPATGMNKGFRARNNAIYTFQQEKTGFSYFYCKRKVLNDGIHTIPLNITLCPHKTEGEVLTDEELVDMLLDWMD